MERVFPPPTCACIKFAYRRPRRDSTTSKNSNATSRLKDVRTWRSGSGKETTSTPSFSDDRSTRRCRKVTCCKKQAEGRESRHVLRLVWRKMAGGITVYVLSLFVYSLQGRTRTLKPREALTATRIVQQRRTHVHTCIRRRIDPAQHHRCKTSPSALATRSATTRHRGQTTAKPALAARSAKTRNGERT